MVDLAYIKGDWATSLATAEKKVASCEQCDASAKIGMDMKLLQRCMMGWLG